VTVPGGESADSLTLEGAGQALPLDGIRGAIFDLDGVLTDTARVHAAAWKQVFDSFLRERDGAGFIPFDSAREYREQVDGKRRRDGVRSFLASRGIAAGEDEIRALAEAKDALVAEAILRDGVELYEESIAYLHAVAEAGVRRAVVSASRHCAEVLRAAGIDDLFELRVDGVTAEREHLQGKPAPDTFLFAARTLGVEPPACAVFEDALAGVEAGRAGGFGYVVGVARANGAQALRDHGADAVVADLSDLLDRDAVR
jgi:beta-phosphoglucomutase family hydrolase